MLSFYMGFSAVFLTFLVAFSMTLYVLWTVIRRRHAARLKQAGARFDNDNSDVSSSPVSGNGYQSHRDNPEIAS